MSFESIFEEEHEKKMNELRDDDTLVVLSNNIDTYSEDDALLFLLNM